ncbi:serine/threonine-protein kinase 31 isoform X3 [Dendrobates tinctorius]|uniref:serine/threonine-protein kinase 31 isoform X3 n=1 Tax=Dendrobates tinctorius TaxID=92724 RepID=UPI003CC9AFC8
MEGGDPLFTKVEEVYVSHIEDAVTFWGQSMSRINDISKISDSLAKFCPTMSAVFGSLDLDKVYGGMFSADKCWYRCKLLHVVSDEQCAVTYIDYGNSEVIATSSIVELPEELQVPPIAQKYRFWGLQLQTTSDIEQGLKFLTQLVCDKQISVQQKAIYKDGTVVVQVSHDDLDIGEEVAKKGFAVRCRLTGSPNSALEPKDASVQFPWQSRIMERPRMREPKALPMFPRCVRDSHKEHFGMNNFQAPSESNDVRSDEKFLEENEKLKDENEKLKDENKQLKNENLQLKEEKKQHVDECGQLKEDKEVLAHKLRASALHMQKIELESKKEKECFIQSISDLELRLKSAAGNKLKALTAKIEILKGVRRENGNMTAADDLLEAVKAVSQEQLSAPSSLNALEETWKEYSLAQKMIQECSDVVELDLIIDRRNKIKEQLNSSVEAFAIDVDQLPFESRLTNLQVLLNSLEVVYGASCDCEDLDAGFQEFYHWKQAKLDKFNTLRSDTDSSLGLLATWMANIEKFFDLKSHFSCGSCDIVLDIDNILEKVDFNVSKELEISLVEPGEEDRKIITNAYNKVVKLIFEETCLISALKEKYLASLEFKKNMSEWMNKNPNVDDLIMVKKSIKSLKAQLRWKLLESSSMEESDDYNATAHSEVKHEIETLRSKIFYEIQQEQNEYFDPVVYLMVPFYPGESLGYIQANNKLTSYETVRVMKGVAHGLHTLHASNIIIGSLHDNNVFAVNRERGIVGDFDFTRNAEERSSASSICFPLLTAPEVKLGQPPSASSDVYSYGILLLWLCTGKKNVRHNSDGTPDLDKSDLDFKTEALLSRLVCCGDRMPTEHIKMHEYFQVSEPEYHPLPDDETDDNMPADFA